MLKYIATTKGTPNLDQLEEALEGRDREIRDTLIDIAAQIGSTEVWGVGKDLEILETVAAAINELLDGLMPEVDLLVGIHHWRAIRDELQQRGQA